MGVLLKRLYENDPLKLKRFNSPYYKTLYKLAIAIPVFLLISLIFFLITFATDRTYKVKEFNKQLHEWRYQDTNSSFSSIRLRAKLMPSRNTEGNLHIMYWSNTTTEFETDKKLLKDDGYERSFHYFNNTNDIFPSLYFLDDYMPVGDAMPICLHIYWAPADRENVVDMYKSAEKFPVCINAANARTRWQDHDPTEGVDMKAWEQVELPMTCTSIENCKKQCGAQKGYFIQHEGGGTCYQYMILNHVCIKMAYRYNGTGDEDNWVYDGGCFANNSVLQRNIAEPGQIYDFNNITIEVRSSKDPYTIASSHSFDFGKDLWFFSFLAFINFFAAMVCLVIFGFAYFYLWKSSQDAGIPPHIEQHDEPSYDRPSTEQSKKVIIEHREAV